MRDRGIEGFEEAIPSVFQSLNPPIAQSLNEKNPGLCCGRDPAWGEAGCIVCNPIAQALLARWAWRRFILIFPPNYSTLGP